MATIIAFVHIEKAAGTTVTELIRKSLGSRHVDVFASLNKTSFNQDDLDLTKKVYPDVISIAGHRVKPFINFTDDVLFYTILRDPIKRCISHYQYLVETSLVKVPSFKEWINKEENQNFQTKKIAGEDSFEKAINIINDKFAFVGLLEEFENSMKSIFERLPYKIKYMEYNTKNIAKNNTIKNNILNTPELYNLLIHHNKSDIELYDYIKGSKHKIRERVNEQTLFKKTTFKWISGTLKRNLIFKPIIRLSNFKKVKSIKIDFQMVGLERSFFGHFYPSVQIKLFKVIFYKRKKINGLDY